MATGVTLWARLSFEELPVEGIANVMGLQSTPGGGSWSAITFSLLYGVNGFGYLPGYVEMFKHFSKNFKSTHPRLLIVSGGVTTAHPREKAGFSRGMYQQAAGFYDIAAYHAHGPVLNNEQAQQRVEKWLQEVGQEKRYCNTETGDRSLYSFRKDDGRFVYVGWPTASKRGGLLWIKTSQSVEVSDMFGATQNVAPLGNVLPIGFGDQPLYLSGKNIGERIQLCSPQEQFLQVNTEVNIAGDQPSLIPVAFRNPTNKSLEGTLTFQDDNGRAVAKQSFSLEAGKTTTWSASVDAGAGDNYDERTFQLSLKFADRALPGFSFPVQLIRSYPIRRLPQLDSDPTKWPSLEAVPAITLNRPDQVVELTYDPSIPAWKGPDDLSAVARMVHDERGIRFQVEVKEDTAGAIQRKDQLFRGDDVQVAIGRADEKEFAIVDLGLSAEGSAAWCALIRPGANLLSLRLGESGVGYSRSLASSRDRQWIQEAAGIYCPVNAGRECAGSPRPAQRSVVRRW